MVNGKQTTTYVMLMFHHRCYVLERKMFLSPQTRSRAQRTMLVVGGCGSQMAPRMSSLVLVCSSSDSMSRNPSPWLTYIW